jgi:excisionase family DNA binding protein
MTTPTDKPQHPTYLTPREAAAYSRLSLQTLARLEEAGKLKFHRPSPRKVVIARDELDRYVRGS